MKKYQKEGLLKIIERQIIGILIANGLVTLRNGVSKYSFPNTEITAQGEQKVSEMSPVTEKDIEEYMSHWPVSCKTTASAIRPKLERFFSEHERYTMRNVVDAVLYHLSNNAEPWCGKASNFIYLMDRNKHEDSKLLSTLKAIEEINGDSSRRSII